MVDHPFPDDAKNVSKSSGSANASRTGTLNVDPLT
jgi:hypothetical protein